MLLKSSLSDDVLLLALQGAWCMENIAEMERALAQLPAGHAQVRIDCAALQSLDLSGAWLLQERLAALRQAGASIEFTAAIPAQLAFLQEMAAEERKVPDVAKSAPAGLRDALAWVGRASFEQLHQARDATGYFGRLVLTLRESLRSVRHLRIPSIARHIHETGIQAIPIVALIAFLISVIVAYLGAQQLRRFGAEIFTIDLVAIAVLREMGVLLTAIIVAGRSGSAFAAEIGVMHLNEEVDALRSMGIDYFEVLVLPRVIGLLVALPLLTIVADAMGLIGGGLLSATLLDIPPPQYLVRVQDALAPTTFWAGMVKAPVFALLIAMVGTYRGMQVRGSSRELGRLTTVAVVQSIFLVILADAIFAIIFVELDF